MYNQISSNKRKTWFLLALMSSLILGLIFVIGISNGAYPEEALTFGILFTVVYALVSYYASAKIALGYSGAKEIQKTDAPDLWNVIENLCIANGQPMPKVYIINDPSPNAFATGRDPKHAAIAFTTGILELMNREEIAGIAAHELSHVKNYDIRVMTIVVVLVGAIALITDLFLRSGSLFRGRDRNVPAPLIIVGLILAILSPIIAELIKLAISKKREFLADASGALLTRYPEGLASALEKLKQNTVPLKRASHATAHLFISSPFGDESPQKKPSFFNRAFSTHPPLEERIAILKSMGR